MKEVQLALDNLGAIESTALHLCGTADDVVREALAFMAAMLWDSNTQVQVGIRENLSVLGF